MRTPPRALAGPSRRVDTFAGVLAGLGAGLVVGWLEESQGMLAHGFMALAVTGPGLGLQLLFTIGVGAAFGVVFGYRPGGYATTISAGLFVGLLSWVVVSLTLLPLLVGQRPTWSLADASLAFPFLIGDLLAGGLIGLGLHLLVSGYRRVRPETVMPVRQPRPAQRVVILGGGFGGVSAAEHLERHRDLDVTLVSHSNYLLFTPMLAEVASSSLGPQHISAPVRAACVWTSFRRAEIEAIDTVAQVVSVKTSATTPPEELRYDHLILALGAVPNYHGLPGMAEHSLALKTLDDATRLRNRMIGLLEQADVEQDPSERRRQLTFVVAGGGFAGAEMIAELFDLVHSVLRYYPNIERSDPRFVLVHGRERILPELTAELADYALRKLQARGIEFRLSTRVAGATGDAIQLGDGSEIPTRTVVWTAGNQPNPLLGTLPCERTRAGAVVVDGTLRVKGMDNVWAVGDCAAIPDPDKEGSLYPPTAQHALREGKAVAANVAAVLRGQAPEPFRFKTIGLLVALGHRRAAAEIRGLRFSGLLAWLMWRTVYFAKLPGLEKKLRVALDWGIDLFFPRDIVLTHPTLTPTLSETFPNTRKGKGA